MNSEFEDAAAQFNLARPNLEPTNTEILERLSHIASLLVELKDGGSIIPSGRSLRSSFLETAVQQSSPLTEPVSGGTLNISGSSGGVEDRAYDHDPLTLYAANSPEYMLRWPIYKKVITDAEKHVRSFLLDSLDNQPASGLPPPRQVGIGSFEEIRNLCSKYVRLVHRRNPVVDVEKLERYAREVTVQGLGWDGPSCQVVVPSRHELRNVDTDKTLSSWHALWPAAHRRSCHSAWFLRMWIAFCLHLSPMLVSRSLKLISMLPNRGWARCIRLQRIYSVFFWQGSIIDMLCGLYKHGSASNRPRAD